MIPKSVVSDWMVVSQDQIQKFADATCDPQWIHVDPARAERESPKRLDSEQRRNHEGSDVPPYLPRHDGTLTTMGPVSCAGLDPAFCAARLAA